MTHFIMLPDGTIINVAHVRKVRQPHSETVYIYVGQTEEESQDDPHDHYDPDGAIYAWFADKAERIGGES